MISVIYLVVLLSISILNFLIHAIFLPLPDDPIYQKINSRWIQALQMQW